MKLAYRRLERALQTWEAVRCAAGGEPIPIHFWKRLTFAQFHDFLPGSSIHEVYEQLVGEINTLAAEALGESVRAFSSTGEAGWFNPLPLPLPVHFDGPSGDMRALLPPLGACSLEELRSKATASEVRRLPQGIANERVEVQFDSRGNVESLSVDGANLLAGPLHLVSYRDIPYDLEAWEIDRQALDTGVLLQPEGMPESLDGVVWKAVRQLWKTEGGSTVLWTWKLRAGSPVLEAELEVDWREPERWLRLEVPTPYQGEHALFAAPYGGEWRPQQPGNIRASAQWEVPANRWVMACDEGRAEGTFLVTEAKYGFSARDGVIGVSLLRSAKVTVTTAYPAAFRQPGPARDTFSDLGAHTLRLALGHLGANAAREDHPAALAETLFAAPVEISLPAGSAPSRVPAIEGMPSLIPVWAAPWNPKSWVLRLHETLGRRGSAEIMPPPGWKVRRINGAFPDSEGEPAGNRIEVSPFAIISLELYRGAASEE